MSTVNPSSASNSTKRRYSGEPLLPRWMIRHHKLIILFILAVFTILLALQLKRIQELYARRDAHYAEGRKELATGNLSKARIELRKALAIDSKFAKGYCALGEIDERENKISSAESMFLTSIKLDPQHAKAYFLWGKLLLKKEDWDKALEKLTSALRLNYKVNESYYLRGVAYESRKGKNDLDLAKENYTKSIETPPKNYAPACFRFARILCDEGKFEEAIPYLTKALVDKKSKDYTEALALRAKSYHELSNYDKAITDWTEACELHPQDATNYDGRAHSYLAAHNYPEAIADFTKASQLDPSIKESFRNSHSDAVSGQGRKLRDKQQFRDAIDVIAKFEKIHPTSTTPVKKLKAECYYLIVIEREKAAAQDGEEDPGAQGDAGAEGETGLPGDAGPQSSQASNKKQLKEDIHFLTTALKADPENSLCRMKRGERYLQIEDYPNAIADFTVLINKTDDLRALLARGSTYRLMKDLKKANADFTKALRVSPSHLAARLERGKTYLAESNYDAAIADLQKLAGDTKAELSKQVQEEAKQALLHAYEKRADIHLAKNEYKSAVSDLTRAIDLDSQQSDLFYRRGLVYALRNEHELAIKDFTQVISIDASRAEAYFARAKSHTQCQQTEQANSDHSNAVKLSGNTPNPIAGQPAASRQARKGLETSNPSPAAHEAHPDKLPNAKKSLAQRYYQTVLEREKKAAQIHKGVTGQQGNAGQQGNTNPLAKEIADKKRFKEDVLLLTIAVEADPENTLYRVKRGERYLQIDNYEAAVADFDTVLKQKPADLPPLVGLRALMGRGTAKKLLKDFKTAEADFTAALELDPNHTPAMIGRGEARLASGNYDGAIADLQEAHDLAAPEAKKLLIDAHRQRADARSKAKDYPGAIDDLNVALGLDPQLEKEINPQLEIAHGLNGKELFEKKDFENALKSLSKVVTLAPNAPYGYVIRGDCHRALGDLTSALADYQKALELKTKKPDSLMQPVYIRVLVEIGDIKYQTSAETNPDTEKAKQLNAAIQTFTKAISASVKCDVVDPEIVARAYAGRGKAQIALANITPNDLEKLLQNAITDYQQARKQKDSPELKSSLAKAACALGAFYFDSVQKPGIPLNDRIKGLNNAVTQFELATGLETDNPLLQKKLLAALAQRGSTLLEANKPTEAIADFDRVLKNNPAELQSLVGRGSAYQLLKDFEKAEKDFTDAIAIDSNQLRALRGRGEIRLNNKDYDGAIADLQKAHEGNEPGAKTPLIDAHRKRADARMKAKNYAGAIDDFNAALTLNPKLDKEIHPQLTVAYRLNGKELFNKQDFKNAITSLNEAIKITPNDTAAHAIRGDCLRALGNLTAALADYNKVLQLRKDNPQVISQAAYVRVLVGLGEIEGQNSADKKTTAEKVKQLNVAVEIFELAIKEAQKIADVDPEVVGRAHWGRAKTQVSLADLIPENSEKLLISAIRGFEKARSLGLKENPELTHDFAVAASKLGSLYYSSVQKPGTDGEDLIKGLSKAVPQFELALRLEENALIEQQLLMTLAQRGQALLKANKSAAAIQDFDRVLKKKPKDLQSLVGRGTAHQLLRDLEKAEKDFTDALAIDPNQLRSLRGRGEIRLLNKQFDEAIIDLQKAYAGNEPKAKDLLTEALRKRGEVHIKAKNYPKAIDDLNAALALDPKLDKTIHPRLAEAYRLHGKELFGKKDFKNAIVNLTAAIKLIPSDPNPYVVRGDCHRDLGNLAAALEDYHKVLMLRAKNPNSITQEGYVYALVQIGKIERRLAGGKILDKEKTDLLNAAIKTFTKAISEADQRGDGVTPQIVDSAYWGRAKAQVDLADIVAEEHIEKLLTSAIKDYERAKTGPFTEDPLLLEDLVTTISKLGSFYFDSAMKPQTPLDKRTKGLTDALTQFKIAEGLKKSDLLQQRIINTLVARGRSYVESHQLKAATEKLDAAIEDFLTVLKRDAEQRPKLAGKISHTYFLRAMEYYWIGDRSKTHTDRESSFVTAIADFETAETFERTVATNHWRLLAECQLGLERLPKGPKGDKAVAIAHLTKSLPLDPELKLAVEKVIAKLLFVPKVKTHQQVLDDLSVEVLSLYPDLPFDFQITIETAPENEDEKTKAKIAREKLNLKLDLARSTLSGERVPEAIRNAYTPIIKLGKVTPEAYFARGIAYQAEGMKKHAALDFKIAGVMSRFPDFEQITRAHYPYFEFVQGCDRMLIVDAKKRIIPPKKTKGLLELASDVRREIKRLEK